MSRTSGSDSSSAPQAPKAPKPPDTKSINAGAGGQWEMLSSLSKSFSNVVSVYSYKFPLKKNEKEQIWVLFECQVRLFQRWQLPSFSLIWCFDFPGYPENMPSLQSHKNPLCEVHLKVSTNDRNPTPGAFRNGLFPGIISMLSFHFLKP